MSEPFPSAVPQIPVNNVARAAVYYEKCLGFHWDWGVEDIGQVTRGNCRLFLPEDFPQEGAGTAPVVIWINLNSKAEVDKLHEASSNSGARIVAAPESKPWNLHEFTRSRSGWQFASRFLRLCMGTA